MYLLPGGDYKIPVRGCGEKIRSYMALADLKLPILKSVVISSEEIYRLGQEELEKIKEQLKSDRTMLRYIYRRPCHKVRNGGKIIDISCDSLVEETESGADLWLLEPSIRENNLYCCNICLDKVQMNLHIEILGRGFDISDINKGKICPHEIIDIPYPIYYGAYGDWWKWARFCCCTQNEYKESIIIRKERLRGFQSNINIFFDEMFCPVDNEFMKKIFEMIQTIESNRIWERTQFYNLSCSFEASGRVICWDIQTPGGKTEAYC